MRQSNKWWFVPALGALSALDAYLVILPNEAILMGAVTALPKRWFICALAATIGSAIGAASVAWLVAFGSTQIMHLFHADKLMHTRAWLESAHEIRHHGLWGLALISFSPLPQHAAVIIAGLGKMKIRKVFFAVLIGRFPKYAGLAYLAAKSPAKLKKWHLLPKAA